MKEPVFEDVDNPGKWHPYSFRAHFIQPKNKPKTYAWHQLPTGVRPCPIDEEEQRRVSKGWEFHYDKWKASDNLEPSKRRSGSTQENLFPDERKGRLDDALLKEMGLTRTRLLEGDALFFFQLLFPICDPKRSGIENDPRKPRKRRLPLHLQGITTLGHVEKPTMKLVTMVETQFDCRHCLIRISVNSYIRSTFYVISNHDL